MTYDSEERRDSMYKFKSLRCPACSTVAMNLPEAEVMKLQGMRIRCENCGRNNSLTGFALNEVMSGKTPLPAIYEWETALDS